MWKKIILAIVFVFLLSGNVNGDECGYKEWSWEEVHNWGWEKEWRERWGFTGYGWHYGRHGLGDRGSGGQPVPEPATLMLFGTGLVALASRIKRKV